MKKNTTTEDAMRNKNDGRISEVKEGLNGSGRPVWSVQWEGGFIDSGFTTEAEAINWAYWATPE